MHHGPPFPAPRAGVVGTAGWCDDWVPWLEWAARALTWLTVGFSPARRRSALLALAAFALGRLEVEGGDRDPDADPGGPGADPGAPWRREARHWVALLRSTGYGVAPGQFHDASARHLARAV